MNHYVLVRAAYPSEYPIEANARRLEYTRRVTVPSLVSQTTHDFVLCVKVTRDDPLLHERIPAFMDSGLNVRLVTAFVEAFAHERDAKMTTRLDDDDAFAFDAFEHLRIHAARREKRTRAAFVFPNGWVVAHGNADTRYYPQNQFCTLYTPAGDRAHVMQAQHTLIATLAPVEFVANRRSWVWVRHEDTIKPVRVASGAIDEQLRVRIKVDWAFLEEQA